MTRCACALTFCQKSEGWKLLPGVCTHTSASTSPEADMFSLPEDTPPLLIIRLADGHMASLLGVFRAGGCSNEHLRLRTAVSPHLG